MNFQTVGDSDNMLLVSLEQNEEVSCESNAMVMMEGNLDLTGEVRGGFWSAVGRRIANGESFFTQSIKAKRGNGDCLLSPTLPGDVHILNCAPGKQYRLNDGAFLACASSVQVRAKTQGIGRALFGGTGGFFIGETSGTGQLAISGFGTVMELDINTAAYNPTIIDNNHVIAWDASLDYEPALSTNRSVGFFGSLVNSVTSGEGIVCKFSGKGSVVVCSRNRRDFVSWMGSQIAPSS
jgi:uncharacterized protein (TIGR00266 family)